MDILKCSCNLKRADEAKSGTRCDTEDPQSNAPGPSMNQAPGADDGFSKKLNESMRCIIEAGYSCNHKTTLLIEAATSQAERIKNQAKKMTGSEDPKAFFEAMENTNKCMAELSDSKIEMLLSAPKSSGRANGQGRFRKSNGDVYEGQWKDDRAHGEGSCFHVDGSSYLGQWQEDKKHGFGTETWPDGSRFEGSYARGRKNGSGLFTSSAGATFKGEFRNDAMEGFGTYIYTDGRTYEGQWSRNRMNGVGKMLWPDGRLYEGGYKDDQKSGNGKFSWTDGRSYEGQWVNGKQHGRGIYEDGQGNRKHGEWHEGKRSKIFPSNTPSFSPQDGCSSFEISSCSLAEEEEELPASPSRRSPGKTNTRHAGTWTTGAASSSPASSDSSSSVP